MKEDIPFLAYCQKMIARGDSYRTILSYLRNKEASPEEIAAQEAMIEETYQWFKNLVAERRNLSGSALDAVTTGGVFSGRKAVENGLIDALGGERTPSER